MAFITTFFRLARPAAAANRNGWALSSLLPCILVCTVSFMAGPVHAEPESSPREVVRIGFLAFDGETTYIDRNDEMLVVTERYLKEAIPEYSFDIRRYGNEELLALVESGELDLFLTSSGAAYTTKGAVPFATLITEEADDPNYGVAGVFIVKKDSPIRRLEDARGASAVGTGPQKFMNWQVAVGEIARLGYDPENFFSSIRFVGSDLAAVPRLVAEGAADVGVMRACTLEPMLVNDRRLLDSLRVLEPAPEDGLRCLHSSALYPDWTFAAVPGAPPPIVKRVAQALFNMDPDQNGGYGWSIATKADSVDELFQLLKIGPYEHLRVLNFAGFLEIAKPYLLALAALFLAWIVHWWRVEALVRRRTADLKEAQQKIQEAQKKLSQLLRLGVVNQFSTVIAHELHQPLAATKYLADAVELMTHQSEIDSAKLRTISSKISDSVSKVASIVERVRSYAKSRALAEAFDLVELLKEVTTDVGAALHANPEFSCKQTPLMVCGDRVALQIAFANLLKNACEAAHSSGKTFVQLRLSAEGDKSVISVENDGPLLSEDFIAKIGRPMQSEKLDGMGYGILIALTILETHQGAVRFSRREKGGLLVVVRLPLLRQPSSLSFCANTHD